MRIRTVFKTEAPAHNSQGVCAAEDRAADHQKQVVALQQRVDESRAAVQLSERQSEEVQKERQAWAHEREELHRGLDTVRAACSDHVQKLLAQDEDSKEQAQMLQQLQLELQHQQDAVAHAQEALQAKAQEVPIPFLTYLQIT